MCKINSRIQRRFQGVKQGKGLGLAHGVRVHRDQISKLRKAVGCAHGRTAVSRFDGLKVAVLRKRVQERLEIQRAAMSGKLGSEGKTQFQILGGLESDVDSPEVRLRIDEVNAIAVELEIGPQFQIAMAAQPSYKTGHLHGAENAQHTR